MCTEDQRPEVREIALGMSVACDSERTASVKAQEQDVPKSSQEASVGGTVGVTWSRRQASGWE